MVSFFLLVLAYVGVAVCYLASVSRAESQLLRDRNKCIRKHRSLERT